MYTLMGTCVYTFAHMWTCMIWAVGQQDEPLLYMDLVEMMTRDLGRCLLVRGSGAFIL